MKPFSENIRRLLRRGTPFVIVVAAGCPGPSSPAPSSQPDPTPAVTPQPTPDPGVKPRRPSPFDEPETVPGDPASVDTSHPHGLRQGRPLRVRGKIQRPRVTSGRSWHDSLAPELASLPARTRERLAAEWLRDARDEHASIAAFARLSLDLLALGAPPELLTRTHQAAQDEVEHARACFTLASRYRGESLDPGIFPEASAAPAPGRTRIDRLRRLAQESLEDGCFGEGTAAAVAAHAAQGTQDPVVREVLAKIATDESRHAELGWAVLAWCVEVGGPAVVGTLDLDAITAERSVRRQGGLEEHGRLGTRAIEI